MSSVVPSHLTLAAALYFAPLLEDLKHSGPRPPVFVLDSNRLAPYIDAADDFDNRYIVELPDAQAFGRLGIRYLLYVTGRARDRARRSQLRIRRSGRQWNRHQAAGTR